MPPALRTLWQARIEVAVPTFLSRLLNVDACLHDAQGHSCLAPLPFGQSSVLPQSAFDAPCRPNVAYSFVMRSASVHRDSLLDTCRQDAKLPFRHVNSQACRHHVKVFKCKQHAQSSHIHTSASGDPSLNDDASASIQALENMSSTVPQPLKPYVLSQQSMRSQNANQHTCHANDSSFTPASESKGKCFEALHPSQAWHISARCKGQEKSQSAAAAWELLRQKVSLLELEQVSLCDATILGKSRAFKSASFEHLAAVLKVLKGVLGSGEKACRSLAMNSRVLLHSSELVEQKLKVLADFGVREEVIKKLCTTKDILTRKVESLHKTLNLFEEIGLTVEARNRLLHCNPFILRYSEAFILQSSDFIKAIGMSRKEIKCSLCMPPAHLLLLFDNLRKKYDCFQQLGFTVNELTRVTRAGLPWYSIETVQAKIDFLKDQGFSDSDVHLLISRCPRMLTLSYKALKSKLDFLLCEQNYDMADIVKFPACLSCSLEGRLIPRLTAVNEKGLSGVYALSTILACSDLTFQKLGTRGKGQ